MMIVIYYTRKYKCVIHPRFILHYSLSDVRTLSVYTQYIYIRCTQSIYSFSDVCTVLPRVCGGGAAILTRVVIAHLAVYRFKIAEL